MHICIYIYIYMHILAMCYHILGIFCIYLLLIPSWYFVQPRAQHFLAWVLREQQQVKASVSCRQPCIPLGNIKRNMKKSAKPYFGLVSDQSRCCLFVLCLHNYVYWVEFGAVMAFKTYSWNVYFSVFLNYCFF